MFLPALVALAVCAGYAALPSVSPVAAVQRPATLTASEHGVYPPGRWVRGARGVGVRVAAVATDDPEVGLLDVELANGSQEVLEPASFRVSLTGGGPGTSRPDPVVIRATPTWLLPGGSGRLRVAYPRTGGEVRITVQYPELVPATTVVVPAAEGPPGP